MNVDYLRDLIRDLPGDMEVRLMTQANYPFEYSVSGLIGLDDLHDFQVTEREDPDEPVELFQPASDNGDTYFGRAPYCGPGILYLLEGTQLGYGTSDAWAAAAHLNGFYQ